MHEFDQQILWFSHISVTNERSLTLQYSHHFHSIEEINQFITNHPFAFLYISKTNCSVCHALLPKVKEIIENYPKIQSAYINIDDIPSLAGHLSIFTAPVLILYVDGKEILREARFVHLDEFQKKVEKIYMLAE